MNAHNPESGNVLFYILIAVALLAALSFAVSQSNRASTTYLKEDTAKLYATEIMNYSNTIASAVAQLRLRGCTDTEISFKNDLVNGYDNPNAPTDESCNVFSVNGGGANYQEPPDVTNSGFWMFTGRACIKNVGDTNGNCWNNGIDDEDLMMVLPRITSEQICTQINRALDYTGSIPGNAGDGDWTEDAKKFIGNYANASSPDGANGQSALCFKDDDKEEYHFYQVLIAR